VHTAASSAAPTAAEASGRVAPVSPAKRGQMGGGAEDPSGPYERQRAEAAPEGLGVERRAELLRARQTPAAPPVAKWNPVTGQPGTVIDE
jgi:hypothetical protein